MLSQLSYVPEVLHVRGQGLALMAYGRERVGVLGFEPRTSALSELRSSQLSYTPKCTMRRILSSRYRGVQPLKRRNTDERATGE